MKVAVLMPIMPFVYGGGEKMAEDLVLNLNRYGHNARLYYTVYNGYRLRHFAVGFFNSSLLRFDDVDMVIPLTPVNININHPIVVPWLIGQTKSLYEFFDDSKIGFARFGAEGYILRDITHKSENVSLHRLKRLYTISPRVQELISLYNGVSPQVLPLPLDDDDNFKCSEYGDFILYHSRLHPQKRQHLAIEAMVHTKTPVKLLVAGADNHEPYVKSMKSFIESNNLADKVRLLPQRFSDEQKYEWLSTCLGGLYLGEDEDYWAIVTTELMLSKKPVIAPIDTGATKYAVKDGLTGFQPESSPETIAEVMDKLYLDKIKAKEIGENGCKHIKTLCPTWEIVVNTLTEGSLS